MTSDPTLSAYLIASGRLAYPRSSRRRRLGFQVGNWYSPISRSSADPRNSQGGLRMILLSQNQPRSRPINAYEMRYGMRGAYQEAADTSSACGAARQKPGRVIVRQFCDWIVCDKLRNTLIELRMILLSQTSSDQC
jgi:hypothetical protein